MSLELQIIIALAIDFIIGDPKNIPHPVNGIADIAKRFETFTRWTISNEKLAGLVSAIATVATAVIVASAMIKLAAFSSGFFQDIVSIYILYVSFALGGLRSHALAVYNALKAGDLAGARQNVGMMVGRDTKNLDERETSRACVESVAESLVDGVTAPIFFAVVAGPIGAIAYRAVNTMDSLFGYTNEKYLLFGWASARLDDAANYIPARLTAPLVSLVAPLFGLSRARSWEILKRDGRKHKSPNAGLTESAVAGAMGVRLGGVNSYDGVGRNAPYLGDDIVPLSANHIRTTVRLVTMTSIVFTAVALFIRVIA